MTDILYDGEAVKTMSIHDSGEGWIVLNLIMVSGKKWVVGPFKEVS